MLKKILISTILIIVVSGCSENKGNDIVNLENTLLDFKEDSSNGIYNSIEYTNINKKDYLIKITDCILDSNEDKFYDIKNDMMGDGETLKKDIKTTYELLSAKIQNNFKKEKDPKKFKEIIIEKEKILKDKISNNYYNILFNKWTEKSENFLDYKKNQDLYLNEQTILSPKIKDATSKCVVDYFDTKDFNIKNVLIPSANKNIGKISISFIDNTDELITKKIKAEKIDDKWILKINEEEERL